MKNKKTVMAIIAVIALVLVIIGITYAYWLVTKTQTNENMITSGCLDITIDGEANDITLTNQFPLADEDGLKLTPYTFTVTNNCTTSVDYQVNLESIGDSTTAMIPDALKVAIYKEGTDTSNVTPKLLSSNSSVATTITNAYEAYTLTMGTLKSKNSTGASVTYNLLLWIDADAPMTEMNKTYEGKISVSVGQGIELKNLVSSILADAESKKYLYTSIPEFGTTIADGEYGLYTAQDDYGTSYYFRGDVATNYVQFGSYAAGTKYDVETPMYWRIVRVNGDSTIRMIYDGTALSENGVSHEAQVSYAQNDKIYINSLAKIELDDWYDNYLEKSYGNYIADSVFCNDYSAGQYTSIYYAAHDRLETNKNPTLKCVSGYSLSVANGQLINPVGLITADEVYLAGGDSSMDDNYLYNRREFWTMTASQFYEYYSEEYVYCVRDTGSLGDEAWDYSKGIRPVINLNADVRVTGSGTVDDPYVVVTE